MASQQSGSSPPPPPPPPPPQTSKKFPSSLSISDAVTEPSANSPRMVSSPHRKTSDVMFKPPYPFTNAPTTPVTPPTSPPSNEHVLHVSQIMEVARKKNETMKEEGEGEGDTPPLISKKSYIELDLERYLKGEKDMKEEKENSKDVEAAHKVIEKEEAAVRVQPMKKEGETEKKQEGETENKQEGDRENKQEGDTAEKKQAENKQEGDTAEKKQAEKKQAEKKQAEKKQEGDTGKAEEEEKKEKKKEGKLKFDSVKDVATLGSVFLIVEGTICAAVVGTGPSTTKCAQKVFMLLMAIAVAMFFLPPLSYLYFKLYKRLTAKRTKWIQLFLLVGSPVLALLCSMVGFLYGIAQYSCD